MQFCQTLSADVIPGIYTTPVHMYGMPNKKLISHMSLCLCSTTYGLCRLQDLRCAWSVLKCSRHPRFGCCTKQNCDARKKTFACDEVCMRLCQYLCTCLLMCTSQVHPERCSIDVLVVAPSIAIGEHRCTLTRTLVLPLRHVSCSIKSYVLHVHACLRLGRGHLTSRNE